MKDITSREETEQFFRDQNRKRLQELEGLKAQGIKVGGCFGCDCTTECKTLKWVEKITK